MAEREPEGTEGCRSIDAHRCEHVGRFHRTARTRRRRGRAHIGLVEQVQQRFGLDVGDAHMRRPGDLELGRNGLGDPVDSFDQRSDELVAEIADPDVLGGAVAIGDIEGDGGGHDARCVVRAAATFSFLASPDDQRCDPRSADLDEDAHTLGPAELVGAEREQIDVRGEIAQIEPACRLHRIGMEQGIGRVPTNDRRHRLDVGDRSDLVVDRHHADDRHVRFAIEHGSEFIEIDPAERVDADHPAAGVFDHMEHGVMLDRRAHSASAEPDGAGDGHVVALGAAAREHHLVGSAADSSGDHVAGFVDRLTGAASEPVRTGRVRVHVGEIRHHRLDRGGVHRCRCRMVEVRDRRLGHPPYATAASIGPHRDEPDVTEPGAVIGGRRSARILGPMRGYDHRSYGQAMADVYDEWYADVTDVSATVERMLAVAGAGGRVLELGVGTGRLAVPMAAAGLIVVGVDSSEAMLAELAARDPHGAVDAVLGDMVDGLPDDTFDAALIAYNTMFNLLDADGQQRCFEMVAARLKPGGAFVVEAFVPDTEQAAGGSDVTVRSIAADRVVLSVSVTDPATQRAEGQFVQFTESGGVRLRPWSIRWSTPRELDAMAEAAGLILHERYADMAGAPFDDASAAHVSVYVHNDRGDSSIGPER